MSESEVLRLKGLIAAGRDLTNRPQSNPRNNWETCTDMTSYRFTHDALLLASVPWHLSVVWGLPQFCCIKIKARFLFRTLNVYVHWGKQFVAWMLRVGRVAFSETQIITRCELWQLCNQSFKGSLGTFWRIFHRVQPSPLCSNSLI